MCALRYPPAVQKRTGCAIAAQKLPRKFCVCLKFVYILYLLYEFKGTVHIDAKIGGKGVSKKVGTIKRQVFI